MTEKLCGPEEIEVRENLLRVKESIASACQKAGRDPGEVTLLAVSKTVSPEKINAAISAGVDRIGENRVQEYLQKREALLPVEAHLIGHLQTNKVNAIVGKVAMIQSLDSLRLAAALDAASKRLGIVTDVLAEVNIGGEESKSGISPEEAEEFCEKVREFSGLRLCGMMTVPPISDSEQKKREYFSRMWRLFVDIRDKNMDNRDMSILSMGMSDDFPEAIQEGSTMVRIGSAIFGKRQYNI